MIYFNKILIETEQVHSHTLEINFNLELSVLPKMYVSQWLLLLRAWLMPYQKLSKELTQENQLKKLLSSFKRRPSLSGSMEMGTVCNGCNKPEREDFMLTINFMKTYKISKLLERYLFKLALVNKHKYKQNMKTWKLYTKIQ